MDIREVAHSLLCKIQRDGKFSNIALDSEIKRGNFSLQEMAALTALVYGVTERGITLDYYIACAAERDVGSIDIPTKTALRIALYEIIWQGTSAHAAVNEAVKRGKNAGQRGFINAVLRNYLRRRGELEAKAASLQKAKKLSISYSVSMDIARLFRDEYSEEKAASILAAMNRREHMTLRVNTQKISRDEFLDMLTNAGINSRKCRYSEVGVELDNSMPLSAIPGFENGAFYVQDEASQLCAALAAPNVGDTFIDTCSCPGSKSFGVALYMKNQGQIYSFDARSSKLSLIDSGAQRLGISIIKASERDAREPDKSLFGQADSVLCDVPCSGLGVIAKKPDLRYKTKENIDSLPPLQYGILSASSDYVKAGGKLVYSTCTLNPAENEKNVLRFLDEHPDFTAVDFSFGSLSSRNGMLTLFPDEHGCDGFFIALLTKKDKQR